MASTMRPPLWNPHHHSSSRGISRPSPSRYDSCWCRRDKNKTLCDSTRRRRRRREEEEEKEGDVSTSIAININGRRSGEAFAPPSSSSSSSSPRPSLPAAAERERPAKVMSRRGLASRRESERLMQMGLVLVDGKIHRDPASKVDFLSFSFSFFSFEVLMIFFSPSCFVSSLKSQLFHEIH